MSEVVFGVHAVRALLESSPEQVIRIICAEKRDDKRMQSVLSAARQLGLRIEQKEKRDLDKITGGAVHQGIAAECKALPVLREDDLEQLLANTEQPFLLVLDGVTDPHNLGACLRTADAAGVNAVIVPKDKSAQMNATVRKVACGAAERIPLIYVTNLARTLRMLKDHNVWIVGTAGEATSGLYSTNLTGALAIVMGAEGEGMRRLTREHCDSLVNIPMQGSVSSLNVSVATGVTLFEVLRQRLGGSRS